MKNSGKPTRTILTDVDNYNIDTFLDFCLAKSLIMPLKSSSLSRPISDAMLIMVKYTNLSCFIDVRNTIRTQSIDPMLF